MVGISVATLSSQDIGTYLVDVQFCRVNNPTVCAPSTFIVTITSNSQTCNETPTGLAVSPINLDIFEINPVFGDILPPIENNVGSCGPLQYMVEPANAKVFVEYTQIGFKVKVLPGFMRDKVGAHIYTLVASYLNFPAITTQTPFVVTFTDTGC